MVLPHLVHDENAHKQVDLQKELALSTRIAQTPGPSPHMAHPKAVASSTTKWLLQAFSSSKGGYQTIGKFSKDASSKETAQNI